MNEIKITISGLHGSGKSSIALFIKNCLEQEYGFWAAVDDDDPSDSNLVGVSLDERLYEISRSDPRIDIKVKNRKRGASNGNST